MSSLALTGCLTEAGSEVDPAHLDEIEASLSTPVLGGDLPGFPAATAKAIAVAYFNQISLLGAYYPFNVTDTHSWAYAAEDFHYVESYTYPEVCGGYVRRSGQVTDSYCYLRIGL